MCPSASEPVLVSQKLALSPSLSLSLSYDMLRKISISALALHPFGQRMPARRSPRVSYAVVKKSCQDLLTHAQPRVATHNTHKIVSYLCGNAQAMSDVPFLLPPQSFCGSMAPKPSDIQEYVPGALYPYTLNYRFPTWRRQLSTARALTADERLACWTWGPRQEF